MDFFDFLAMIGGLALFLFGMHIMGEGLSKVSGGRLERILERMTDNPIKAVLLGAGVTAVIQSSSATTVMVVGFVNSGIMQLRQAVGIIMGANIGTTVTSWILSLSGLESDNFIIRLLKPTSFSPVLALIGVVLILFCKKEKKQDIGLILVGFAVLMYGMDAMSSAVKPLADVPAFTGILTKFSQPVLGLLAGTVLTAVIQSSSASVGILQALCKTGAVTYATAIPIIMGQNIGTCVTAMISSIGATKNAKKAALVHLYFNLIGTILFMVVFYSINVFVPFAFLDTGANAAGIAVVHSVFNVAATIVLLPFGSLLEKLANLTVSEHSRADESDEDRNLQEHLTVLDSRFLDTPGLAISQSKAAALQMAGKAKEALFEAISLLHGYDEKKAQNVLQLEDMVDHYEDELGSYLVKVSSRDLAEKDSHTLSILLHCIGDFERISDHAVNIMESAKEMYQKEQTFSNKASVELEIFTEALKDIVNTSFRVFEDEDLKLATRVEPLEEQIDYLQKEIKRRHVKRLRKGKCTIEMGFILSDIITSYERVADHCSNIAVCMLQVTYDGFDTHEYLNRIKGSDDAFFAACSREYQQKYMLPETKDSQREEEKEPGSKSGDKIKNKKRSKETEAKHK